MSKVGVISRNSCLGETVLGRGHNVCFYANIQKIIPTFSYLSDRVCSIFNGAGKCCLAHGLRQLSRQVKAMSDL